MPSDRERHLQQHWPAGPWAPGTHTHWFTSLLVPLPTFLPCCPLGQGPGKPPGTRRMYLWASLFHEALFEVVPGDEGHELGKKRHALTPRLTGRGARLPTEPGCATKGKSAMRKDVCARGLRGYIWNVVWMQC